MWREYILALEADCTRRCRAGGAPLDVLAGGAAIVVSWADRAAGQTIGGCLRRSLPVHWSVRTRGGEDALEMVQALT